IHFFEIIGFTLCVIFGKFKPIIEVVNDDYSRSAKQPCASCSHDSDWSGAKNYNRISGLDSAHLRRLVTGWYDIRKQNRIIQIHSFWDNGWTHIGIRDSNKLSLTAIMSSGCM